MIWSDSESLHQCKVKQTVSLNLTIVHPDANIHTRADMEYDDLEFSRNEASVSRLTAFLVDLNPDGTENYDKVKFFSTEIDPVEFHNGVYVLRQTLEVETGTKHVYVGANLKDEHIQAFIESNQISLVGDGPAVNMIMTPDPSHKGQGTDIVMFGQLVNRNDRSPIIDIEEGTSDYYLHADLERLTSKVLLTCKEDADLPGYVETEDEGWVEISQVRYTLNVTNRHTFIRKLRSESYDRNIDPNWNLTESLQSTDGNYSPLGGQFESWTPEELRQRLFDERYSTSSLKYDARRIGGGNSEYHYTEGIYCLENTSYDDINLVGDEKDVAAMSATTHVVMAVRFIPKYVYTGGNVNSGSGPTEMTLDNVFTNYLVATDGHEVGTYWTRTENGKVYYYGSYAKSQYINKYQASEDDFTCYEGGWSYFTTFIDGTPDNLQISYADRECWGIERDHYYILSVDKITRPGSQLPWENYIRVNSQIMPWDTRGSQEVIIKPKGE